MKFIFQEETLHWH